RAVHDFVLSSRGGLAASREAASAIVRRSFSWGFGEFEENAALIQWMQDHNRRAPQQRKVQFYGIDLSGADNEGSFPHAEIALSDAVDFLRRKAPADAASVIRRAEAVLARSATLGYARLSKARDADLDAALDAVDAFLASHRPMLAARST